MDSIYEISVPFLIIVFDQDSGLMKYTKNVPMSPSANIPKDSIFIVLFL